MRAALDARRRHRQRRARAARARRAGGGGGASALRRLPDAHARRRRRPMQRAPPTTTWWPRCVVPAASGWRQSTQRRCGARAHRARSRASASARRRSTIWRCCGARPSCWRWACRCWSAGRASRRWARSPGGRCATALAGQRGGGAGRGAARRAHRARARRGRHGRCAGRVAAARAGRVSATGHRRQHQHRAHEHDATSAPTAFAARWARRRSRRTSCCASAMRSAACCAADERAADGGDRQGHAHLGLHDRVGARSRVSPRPASTRCCSGPLPTPGVAYLTRALRLDLGVVISASHNPYRRQRHQVLLGRAARSCPTTGSSRSRPRSANRRSGSIPPAWARRAASTTPAGATSSSARARCATTCRCAA